MIASLKGYSRIARTLLVRHRGPVRARHRRVRSGWASTPVHSARDTDHPPGADHRRWLAHARVHARRRHRPVSAERASELTEQIQAIVIDPSDFDGRDPVLSRGHDPVLDERAADRQRAPGRDRTHQGSPPRNAADPRVRRHVLGDAPLRFRSGVGGPAVVELSRPDTPIANAAGPWRTNAAFLFAMLVLLGDRDVRRRSDARGGRPRTRRRSRPQPVVRQQCRRAAANRTSSSPGCGRRPRRGGARRIGRRRPSSGSPSSRISTAAPWRSSSSRRARRATQAPGGGRNISRSGPSAPRRRSSRSSGRCRPSPRAASNSRQAPGGDRGVDDDDRPLGGCTSRRWR